MLIYLKNTRDVANCKDLKAEDLRVWAGMLSLVENDMCVAHRGMISKRCSIRAGKVTQSLRKLTDNGFLMADSTVNPKYLSFSSAGRGSAPFDQEYLKDFSRNKIFHAESLRIFYYLLGDIRIDNIVLDTNITEIARQLGSDRVNTSKLVTQLKKEGVLTEGTIVSKKYFIVSESVLGATKRR